MAKESARQKKTVGRVMHEFKHGELKQAQGGKVKNPKQAIAIALREAGASREESGAENRKTLRKTKDKERRGATGQARAEGKRKARSSARGTTRAELYEQAKRRDIPGRSRMTKDELARALKR
ncbi:MAG: hypothetical protein JWN07_3090 [Hyphomicrobiales bacterium]|nr:hypothetical protein [Hyphomicrobiales bacterium]